MEEPTGLDYLIDLQQQNAAQQKQIDALRDALEAVRRLQNRWSHSYHIEHNRAAKELEAALLAVTPQTEGELDYPAWDGDVK